MTQPYAEQSNDIEKKYYRLMPTELSYIGGVSNLVVRHDLEPHNLGYNPSLF